MQEQKISKKFVLVFLLAAILLGGIPLALSQIQKQQTLTSKAWSTSQFANAVCTSSGIVIINVRFINEEASRGMIVKAVDNQSGKSISLGTIGATKTKTGEIDTGRTSLNSGQVTFELAWADSPNLTDSRTAGYSAVAECVSPTLTPTPTVVTTTPTTTASPSAGPSPTITVCPTPGTVKNVKIQCPYCTPSPSPNQ